MISSYSKNNYGYIFRDIITIYKPSVCVELGVLHGYSTVNIGFGLRQNMSGHLDAYDLFDDYEYNHGDIVEVQKLLKDTSTEKYVSLYKCDAFEVHKKYNDNSVSLLHVDLSNTGDIINKIMRLWDKKISSGGIIIFEGGTKKRDQVKWMLKYRKKPINQELIKNKIINKNYIWGIYDSYPSITVLYKKFGKL